MRLGERVVVGVLAGMLASGPLVGRMPAIAEPTPQAPEVKAAGFSKQEALLVWSDPDYSSRPNGVNFVEWIQRNWHSWPPAW